MPYQGAVSREQFEGEARQQRPKAITDVDWAGAGSVMYGAASEASIDVHVGPQKGDERR